MKRYGIVLLAGIGIVIAALWTTPGDVASMQAPTPPVGPCTIALTSIAPDSTDPWDQRIAELQGRVPSAGTPAAHLEQLGWAFVSKARVSFDPGYYRLAEAAAQCIDVYDDATKKRPESLLLRGHVLHQLHEFEQAEAIARRLVASRGLSYDHGLLGDVLLEQGDLVAAAEAYQAMMDQKPSPRAYLRAAQIRWLTGDVGGAIEAMETAVSAGATRDVESAAWAHVRLATYKLQAGDETEAGALVQRALELRPDYAPALLLKGRMLASENDWQQAAEVLTRAAEINPQPEYHWALIDCLEAAAKTGEASARHERLVVRGAVEDPRTLSLYLATRGQDVSTALELARRELQKRADVHTLDAVSWALFASGDVTSADAMMARALAEGTQDPRLFLHAGVIASAAGRTTEASAYLSRADTMAALLLPSERVLLHSEIAAL